ncbi:MAG: hypothetical protein KGJ13_12235, partial [Patescibacteria group bacterium]|nr:hypothetical protein [Patescibacteria group bacterium]
MSAGYQYTAYLGPTKLDDQRTAHLFAWRGLEGSSVAVPADPTAGESRSKMVACFDCGERCDSSEMVDRDGEKICQDCADAETPAERAAGRMFRAKKKNGEEERISHAEMHTKVSKALAKDPRFKTKDNQGNTRADFYIQDIHQIVGDGDDDDYQAIVRSPAWSDGSKLHAVDFSYEDGEVELGDATEVEPKTTLEAVDRGLSSDGRLLRGDPKKPYGDVSYADPGYQKDKKKRYPVNTEEHAKAAWSYINQKKNADKYTPDQLAHIKGRIKAALKHFGVEVSDDSRSEVDSEKLLRTASSTPDKNSNQKVMPKTVAELTTEAPELVKEIRSETERNVRAAVTVELKDRETKIEERNKEVRALANEADKQHGSRWTGKPGEVQVVGSLIRKIEAEICQLDLTHDAAECRQDFKRKVGELIENSRPAKNVTEA